ncbi:tRNA dihydrouridine synthase DusB [Phaeovibrio sulfidiphilus]|uniref:tRNA-dihydrouridine synthase n=1 Tax=Phaeovibrio sulfidiphilus TaxID=1220600 RepID=A0A8J6Z0P5_9PROT|nr:tRNA dihydrouridine synthase DusB [Phaeovibrio sulfidiphilus]
MTAVFDNQGGFPRLMLAPMAGVTDSPFRRLALRYGCPLVFCEMVLVKNLPGAADPPFFVPGADDPARTGVQLLGNDPHQMAEAARRFEGLGIPVIDINMGCPARKVVCAGTGAALMRDERLAARIIAAVVGAVSTPVSVKMRLGWDRDSLNAPALARIAEGEGAAFVTVHARTREQAFEGVADWDRVGETCAAVSVPVIINGDIVDAPSLGEALRRSGAAGAMVGRAALGAPWVPGQLARALPGAQPPGASGAPSLSERLSVMQEHLEGLVALYGEDTGVRVSRKHMLWYARTLPADPDWARRYLEARSLGGALEVLDRLARACGCPGALGLAS